MICDTIYHNCKTLCDMKNITMRELEDAIHLSPGYLSRAAKMKKDLGISKVMKICEFFEISIEDLTNTEIWKEARIKELEEELAKLKGEQQ